jgi:hypothetical protein
MQGTGKTSLVVELAGGENERGHACPVVEGLARDEPWLGERGEGTLGHHGIAGAKAKRKNRFARARSDIDQHAVDRRGLLTSLMRGERGDHTGPLLTGGAGEDAEALGGEHAVRPTTEGNEAKESFGGDLLNEESNLIHMGGQDNAGACDSLQWGEGGRAEAIEGGGMSGELAEEEGAHGILMARCTVGLGEGLEELDCLAEARDSHGHAKVAAGAAGASPSARRGLHHRGNHWVNAKGDEEEVRTAGVACDGHGIDDE